MMVHRIKETFFTKRQKRGRIFKKWTLPLLAVIHVLVGLGSIVEYFLLRPQVNYIISIMGFWIFISAFLMRAWAKKTLGELHSVHIEIMEDHKIKKNGPYKYLRHPYYLSVMFEVPSLALIPNSYYTFLFAIFTYIPLIITRTYWEESILKEKIGKDYLEYKSRVMAFLPIKIARRT